VVLRELLESDAFRSAEARLPLALGRSVGGAPVFVDLAALPHLLLAGAPGCGKAAALDSMLLSLIYRLTPQQCRLLMIDAKAAELGVFDAIPHLVAPVVRDPAEALAALDWAVGEMASRHERMARLGVGNVEVYNNRLRNAHKRAELAACALPASELEPMPYLVVVIGELAELMAPARKQVEMAVHRLAQGARAVGMHAIIATEQPSLDVITAGIRASLPARIAFKVPAKSDSRAILNEHGAEQLLGQGDMLFAAGSGRILRVHAPAVADEELETVVGHLRQQGAPRYIEGVTEPRRPPSKPAAQPQAVSDELYERAVAIVLRDRKPSAAHLQQLLGIGYGRAAGLIERMQQDGILPAPAPISHAGTLV
jgi:S-DNA-T family DNA segregation ATPase FtsK/SpoIIIE